MEELKALTSLLFLNSSTSLSLPDDNKKSKEAKLLSNIKNNKYSDDKRAALDLYNSSPNDVRYKMLKLRLKKKLYNNLFFIDYNKLKAKSYLHKEQECLHLLHHANILLQQANYSITLNLVNKIQSISEQFDLTGTAISALEIKQVINAEKGLLNEFKRNEALLASKLEQKRCERLAIGTYQFIRIQLNKSIKIRKSFLPTLPEQIEVLNSLWKTAGTFETFNAFYRVSIWYYELIGDFNKIIDLTLMSEKWVKDEMLNPHRFELNYNRFILVYAHLRSKNLSKGLQYAATFLEYFDPHYINWFAYLENYFLLAVHSKEYELSYQILNKAFTNPSYSKVVKSAKERWSLYNAYLYLIYPQGSLSQYHANYFDSNFSPEYSKDKQGFNVAIHILQFIHFLINDDAEALFYRIESLKKYMNTHLKDTFSLRSKTFLKLLILTVTEDFDAHSCKLKGQKLYQKLIDTPTPGDAFAEIEIVPYEHLWELILSTLGNRY